MKTIGPTSHTPYIITVLLTVLLAAAALGEGIPPAPAGTFSVVALPDTQSYSAHEPDVFYAETQWIVDNRQAQRIQFVTHLGDIVDDNIPAQWAVAVRAMSMLDGKVPYGLVVGNHDMERAAGDASLFADVFPARHFENNEWYGGQLKNNVNSFQMFDTTGMKFIVLHLECNAPDDVLTWADGVLTKNADRRAIIATHMFLGPIQKPATGRGYYDDPKGVMHWSKCHGQQGNTPAQLWDKCFSKHRNVFLILCGDQSRSQTMRATLTGARGNTVHACLSDYRGGFLRVYRFIPRANEIRTMTYSVTTRQLCKGTEIVPDEAQHQFTIPYPMAADDGTPEWRWQDVRTLEIEGQGWIDMESPFHRFPLKAKGVVPNAVWGGSTRSAGLCVRFASNADKIAARWTLTSKRFAMQHMPATGVSGLDLYVRDQDRWRWIGVGRPSTSDRHNEKVIASGLPKGQHEFLLYLPLYNGVESLELGVPLGATLGKASPRPPDKAKPICIYGTSIVQGGCASRPGMAHPAILGRRLDRPVINLGFSGAGKMEPELAQLLTELDVAVYVLDCLPNMSAEMVRQRVEPFVEALRQARPDTPILLVENIAYQAGYFLPNRREAYQSKNRAHRAAYERLLAKGIKNLHYAQCERLLGNDGEATVDGTHPTDLGFYRFADALEPLLRRILDER